MLFGAPVRYCCSLRLKCDGTRAETIFRLSAKRTSPFKSAGASVQSTTGSRGVRIGGSNVGYTMFRGSVKSTGYPVHSPVSPSLPLPCVTVCHHISTALYHWLAPSLPIENFTGQEPKNDLLLTFMFMPWTLNKKLFIVYQHTHLYAQIIINLQYLFVHMLLYNKQFIKRPVTYLLTPQSRVLLENLTSPQLVKTFPTFYGNRRFITAFISARHLSLSWARSIQSMPPIPLPGNPF
jgi:hypothetical protein